MGMATHRGALRQSSWLVLRCACALLVGTGLMSCGETSSNTTPSLPAPKKLAKGFCADTCPKGCTTDDDCPTSSGELCCDFGEEGKVCTAARLCPRQCDGDSACNSSRGEACLRVTLESEARICTSPETGIRSCRDDGDCGAGGDGGTSGDVCCTIYDEPICLPANRCPKTCATSDECNSPIGEICCDSLSDVDAALKPGGLCVHPAIVPCPSPCQESSDCDTGNGELCCEGHCSQSCQDECDTSDDCQGQICCKAPAALSPLFGARRLPGYPVLGAGVGCPGFACISGECFPTEYVCDGYADCASSEDELGCGSGGCTAYEYTCLEGSCIDALWRCDGMPDCPSGDDELGCGTGTCSYFEYTCLDASCIDASWVCDGYPDCIGGDDEEGCGTLGCTSSDYQCQDGTCIDAAWLCDGLADCIDGGDEVGCPSLACPPSLGRAACDACCDQEYAAGRQAVLALLIPCACGSGACASSCSSSFCVQPAVPIPIGACGDCVGTSCVSELSNCLADADCLAYRDCLSSCL